MDNLDNTTADTAAPDAAALEAEARGMGWAPREEFRGDPAKWTDAETFVRRGHEVLPIVRAQNKRLEALVNNQKAELAALRASYEATTASVAELQRIHADATKAAVAKARKDLLQELVAAREEGDVAKEVEIQDALAGLRQPAAAPAKPASPPPTHNQPPADPAMDAWLKKNSWYGQDQRKTMKAAGVINLIRADEANDGLEGEAFFAKLDELLGEPSPATRTTKVAPAAPTAPPGGSGSKSYASLPQAAKDACMADAPKLVGPDKAFKTLAAWQDHFAKLVQES